MSRPSALGLSLAAGATLLVLGAAGCSGEAFSVVPSGGPDWSRGLVVGESSLNNLVPMLVDGEGATLAWIDLERTVRLARVDGGGRIAWARDVTVGTPFPHHPALLASPDGTIALFWRSAQNGKESLYHLRLDRGGRPLAQPARISDPSADLEEVRIAASAQGLEVFWAAASSIDRGIRHMGLNHDGSVRSPSRKLEPDGFSPDAVWDGEGTIHLAWWAGVGEEAREIRYAAFDPATNALGPTVVLAPVSHQLWQRPEGPAIGLEPDWVTVFWSLESLGSTFPASTVSYVRFPSRSPHAGEPQSVWLPRHSEPEYRAVSGGLGYRNLADASARAFGTNYIGVPQPLRAGGDRIVTAQEILLYAGDEIQQQIVLTAFGSGEIVGYQIISAGSGASLRPNLSLDEGGELHLSWLETSGFGRYQVLYASTSPRIVEAFDRATLRETGGRALETGFNLLLVILYTPLIATWVAPALAWLLVFFVATGDERLSGGRSWAALATAVGIETVAMAYLPPATLAELPWTEYIPSALARWAAPIPLAGAASLAALGYGRRRGRRSMFLAFFIFAGIHTVLRIWLHLLTTEGLG